MFFNANEIFEIGKQIEVNGGKFYRKAAELATDPRAKDALRRLAEMEASHEEIFGELQEKLTQAFAVDQRAMPDFDQQAANYLKAMATGKIFDVDSDPLKKIKGGEGPAKLLEIAIDFEKNSVVFFAAMKKMVPDALGKAQIDVLIDEEIGHAAMLCEELVKLTP